MGRKTTLRFSFRCLLILSILSPIEYAIANQATNACITPAIKANTLPFFKDNITGKTQISADQTQILNTGVSRFSGNVLIEKDQLRLTADSADFNKQSDTISLAGNIQLDTKTMSLNAKTGMLSLSNNNKQFKLVQFQIPKSNLRGEAQILQLDNENTSHLSNTFVTSCPINKPDWFLKADNITIDNEDAYGSAESAVLNFKGVPLFYMPYFEFPIGDKRRSGILSPGLTRSSARGLELATPWYWNIAPNQDATFTPRFMSKRGTALETDYRYLTHSTTGELNVTYLGHDSITNNDRHYIKYQQNTNFNTKTKLNIDFNDVSDASYNNDFNNTFTSSNQTYLDKEITLEYNTTNWNTTVLAHSAETINPSLLLSDRPYRRLPQVQTTAQFPLAESNLTSVINAELVNFDHEDNSVPTGTRLTLEPAINYILEGDFWYLRPSLELHYTQYDTQDGSGNSLFTSNRTIPISSIDSGLYFERNTDSGLLQTIEPRFFYLNVPFKDQSNVPIFDTDLNDFSIEQLFRNNRFSGNDLVGDTNQISIALTSRLYNPATGNELINASVGQIFFMHDRKVILPGDNIETTNNSDIIAQMSSSINNWKVEAGTQWSPEIKTTKKENFSVQYRPDSRNIFNVSYRKILNSNTGLSDIKHVNTSFIAQITNRISLFGQWDYSLKDNRDITVLTGIVYDSCCWQLSLASQRYLLNDKNQEFDSAITFQLSLKGFGGVSGNTVRNILKQSIPGYTEDY